MRSNTWTRRARKAAAVLVVMVPVALFCAPAASAATVTPVVDCYWDNGNGTYTFSVGYTNSTASTITIPVGVNNYVSPAPTDRGQPTVFLAGAHHNVWAPTLTAAELTGSTNWYVQGNPVQVFGFNRCASKPVSELGNPGAVVLFAAATALAGAGVLGRRRHRARSQATS